MKLYELPENTRVVYFGQRVDACSDADKVCGSVGWVVLGGCVGGCVGVVYKGDVQDEHKCVHTTYTTYTTYTPNTPCKIYTPYTHSGASKCVLPLTTPSVTYH